MRGRKIYEYALKNVPDAIKATIDKAGLDISDISKILIHQANAKMDYAMIGRLFKLYGQKDYDHAISPMTIQELGILLLLRFRLCLILSEKVKWKVSNSHRVLISCLRL
jgi:3-oxoacyl-[acyl-carrier-protein] synthase III